MTPEEPKQTDIPLTEEEKKDFNRKIELERELMKYGCDLLHISEGEWVNTYAILFSEMYQDPETKIKGRFEEVYDKNPEEFYKQVHQEIFDKYKQKAGMK